MTVRGRETTYKDRLFRSQLEARWAAFFDRCGWKWEYEPRELNYYIPDFILQFEFPTLVEVKPLDTFEEMIGFDAAKIINSGWEGEALLLGASQFSMASEEFQILGRLSWISNKELLLECNALGIECTECGQLSISTSENGDCCRVSGCQADRTARHWREANARFAQNWAKAGNDVRWKRCS